MEQNKKLTIGVCLIVKNESECLAKCLESIKEADALYISDTGSQDNTIEIAKKYTDNIYTEDVWHDSFCSARNFILSKADTDFILSIDADESLEIGGIAKIRKAIEFAESHNQKTINCIMEANITGDQFYFPRLFKRCPEVYWKGNIHNYLSYTDNNKSDIKITFSYSKAHQNDPDRALRILKQELSNNPNLIRECFYLAREYWYRKDWITAIYWYKDYLTRANWPPEWAEAWLMLARCYWALNKNDEAKDACLQAIKINADFKEAIEFMAELCGPNNRIKWLEYAELATNNNVLTIRSKVEKKSDYYDKLFANSSDMSRYYHLYNKIGQLVGEDRCLDIGCGIANLKNFIKNYNGFDFSHEAVKIANSPQVVVGNAYDKSNYEGEYDTHIATEVLEHLDDYKILSNIPKEKRLIFSVPNFLDESHLRVYNEQVIKERLGSLIDIKDIYKFGWQGEWRLQDNPTGNIIYLVNAIKK